MRGKIIANLWLLAFVLPEFVFKNFFGLLGPYGSYIFESIFVVAAAIYYRSYFKLGKVDKKDLYLVSILPFFAGWIVFFLASVRQIPIPLDMKSPATILLLIGIAPLLEELIFRHALWAPISELADRNTYQLVLATAVFFSFAHFFSYWFVADNLKPFIFYQTSYTLALGLYCGYFRQRNQGLLAPYLVHLAFNLGFWVRSIPTA